ncbi:hypothetical protein RJ639_007315 [Escallonia herrerae]|uniref:Uncharacterized protein n=1 Tax=Escallonia herrerae TaxID=1293975 RepID=A0AA89AV22_9ASTE|nr:hypothetical protein RJ639_007315 [Escallonia herrerae]
MAKAQKTVMREEELRRTRSVWLMRGRERGIGHRRMIAALSALAISPLPAKLDAATGFALSMSFIYNISHFDFIPTGGMGIRRLFDLCAVSLAIILCLVGICRRQMLRRRVRLLAAVQH